MSARSPKLLRRRTLPSDINKRFGSPRASRFRRGGERRDEVFVDRRDAQRARDRFQMARRDQACHRPVEGVMCSAKFAWHRLDVVQIGECRMGVRCPRVENGLR